MSETTLGLGPCADYKHDHPPVRNVLVEHEERLALGQRVVLKRVERNDQRLVALLGRLEQAPPRS